MTEISLPGLKKIVIHRVERADSAENMVRILSDAEKVRTLYWCDGVVFDFGVNDSDTAKESYVKEGIWHLNYILYANMPTCREIIAIEEGGFKGARAVVADVSSIDYFHDIIAALKEQEKNRKAGGKPKK